VLVDQLRKAQQHALSLCWIRQGPAAGLERPTRGAHGAVDVLCGARGDGRDHRSIARRDVAERRPLGRRHKLAVDERLGPHVATAPA
jgi:hypothetical protein